MKRIILVSIICIYGVMSQNSGLASENLQSENAFYLKLNRDGFNLVGKVLKELFVADIENEPIADISTETQLGVTLHARELDLSAKFTALKLDPQDNGLNITIDVRNIALKSGSIVIVNNLLPIEIICHDTKINIGNEESIPLKIKTKMELKDGNIALKAEQTSFNIGVDNFSVDGPKSCDGPIGTDVLTQPMIHALLLASRPLIENRLEQQVKDMVPGFESMLNALAHQKIPLDISHMPPLPNSKLNLQLQPNKMAMTHEGLNLILSGIFSRETPEQTAAPAKGSHKNLRALGELGINPELINELIAIIAQDFHDYFEIDPKTLPGVEQLFDRDRLSGLLPDLKNSSITSNRIRVFIKLAALPYFYVDEQAQDLRLKMPSIQTKFMVQIGGTWINYFHFQLTIEGGIHPAVENKNINIGISKGYEFSLNGHWDEHYTPATDFYDHELADILIISVFDYLYASSPVVKIAAPETELLNERITIGEITMKDPFIAISLVSEPL